MQRLLKKDYKPAKISTRRVKGKKSQTVPNQSHTIKSLYDKFVRGLPLGVTEKQGVYMDQNDHDFEKLSRLDFGEKAAMAQEFGQVAEQAKATLDELAKHERSRKEEAEQAEQEAQQPEPRKKKVSKKAEDPEAELP